MTGATRFQTRHAYVFSRPWIYKTTKAAESAKRQGIRTEGEWRHLSTHSNRLFYTSTGCSRAPISLRVASLEADDVPGESPETFDLFVGEFAVADEKARAELVRAVGDGSYRATLKVSK